MLDLGAARREQAGVRLRHPRASSRSPPMRRLPELERFRVDGPIADPHDPRPDRAARSARRRRATSCDGAERAFHYVERFGNLGFGGARSSSGERDRHRRPRRCCGARRTSSTRTSSSRCCAGRSSSSGYALVHAACMAVGRASVPDHRADGHRQDDDGAQDAGHAAVLVPVGRPDAALARRAGADLPEAADHQPAHAVSAVKTPLLPARAGGAGRAEPPALALGPAVRR